MNIEKRRVYDITNILEGIGFIEKYKKNFIGLTQKYHQANMTEIIRNVESQTQVPESPFELENNCFINDFPGNQDDVEFFEDPGVQNYLLSKNLTPEQFLEMENSINQDIEKMQEMKIKTKLSFDFV